MMTIKGYVLLETIKKDDKRVDIAELTQNTGFEITGGYIMRIDAADSDDLTFTSKVDGIGTTMNKKVIWMYDYPYPYQIHLNNGISAVISILLNCSI